MLFPFGPVVEPYENEQCFLPAHPLELATKRKKGWGWGLGMPFITGITSHEALLLYKGNVKFLDIILHTSILFLTFVVLYVRFPMF